MKQLDERQTFEKWALQAGYAVTLDGSNNDYRDLRTRDAWAGFRAGITEQYGRALAEQEAGSVQGEAGQSDALRHALEQIASEWDGCVYRDAPGCPYIEIGPALRRSFAAALAQQQGDKHE